MIFSNTIKILGLAFCFGATTLNAQNVAIPDAIFKAYLVANTAINTNGDSEIQLTEATAFSGTMICAGRSITDLTGIEAFINLTSLNCGFNQLTSLDVTQNTSLTTLQCYDNQLTSLDVTLNTSLTILSCEKNQLTNLDVSQNTSLIELNCSQSQIISLDVTQNTSLIELDCSQNQLQSLDVSQNTNLTFLNCSGNQIQSLDVTQNTSITILYSGANQITSLDLTQNTSLAELTCGNDQITSLDLSQNVNLNFFLCQQSPLTSLNLKNGNNTNVWFFRATNNPNLTCIEVDDSTYSANNWPNIDATASFSTNCGFITGLSSIDVLNNLSAYPNPTTKEITIDFGKLYQEANIKVTNLTGQIIINKSIQNSSTAILEIEGAAGIYLVNIQTEEGTATLKVIKE